MRMEYELYSFVDGFNQGREGPDGLTDRALKELYDTGTNALGQYDTNTRKNLGPARGSSVGPPLM